MYYYDVVRDTPEISIKVYEFLIFGEKVFFILNSDHLPPVSIFVESLNKNVTWDESIEILVSELTKYDAWRIKSLKSDGVSNIDIIKRILGSSISEVLDKIKVSIIRDHKIDQITNDK